MLNYVQYFGSNIVKGVAESWVKAEMSWVEVDGAGWSWLLGLVIPYIKLKLTFPHKQLYSSFDNLNFFCEDSREVKKFTDLGKLLTLI